MASPVLFSDTWSVVLFGASAAEGAVTDEDLRHYIDIVIEKVGDQTQIIAEGHAMLVQRFDGVDARLDTMDGRLTKVENRLTKVESRLTSVETGLTSLRDEARIFKAEVAQEFTEVKAMIKLSYAELDGRLRSLEHEVTDLRGRIERLEARSAT